MGPHPIDRGALAAARAEAALTDVGVLADRRSRAIFAACAPAMLGALPFPRASLGALTTITTFLTNWALYDDTIERTGEADVAGVTAALVGEREGEDLPPFLAAFAIVGRGLSHRPAHWRRTFGERFAETTRSVEEERTLRGLLVDGAVPLRRYLAWRRVNIGVLPVLSLIELDGRAAVPGALRDDPRLRAVGAAATDAVLAINDLHGIERDRDGLNLVWCVAAHSDLGRATAWVERFRDAAIRRLERASASLRGTDPRLDAWLAGVRDVVDGFARWHAEAPRYRAAA